MSEQPEAITKTPASGEPKKAEPAVDPKEAKKAEKAAKKAAKQTAAAERRKRRAVEKARRRRAFNAPLSKDAAHIYIVNLCLGFGSLGFVIVVSLMFYRFHH